MPRARIAACGRYRGRWRFGFGLRRFPSRTLEPRRVSCVECVVGTVDSCSQGTDPPPQNGPRLRRPHAPMPCGCACARHTAIVQPELRVSSMELTISFACTQLRTTASVLAPALARRADCEAVAPVARRGLADFARAAPVLVHVAIGVDGVGVGEGIRCIISTCTPFNPE